MKGELSENQPNQIRNANHRTIAPQTKDTDTYLFEKKAASESRRNPPERTHVTSIALLANMEGSVLRNARRTIHMIDRAYRNWNERVRNLRNMKTSLVGVNWRLVDVPD
jgi:hypothetical protein